MVGKLRQYLHVSGGEHALFRTEFCVSYHPQTYPYEELKKSSHYGALGPIRAAKTVTSPRGRELPSGPLDSHL